MGMIEIIFKRFIQVIAIILISLTDNTTWAQDSSLKTYKVGIFAPVYLDSVFSGDNYKYSKNFPKFVVPGLDFIQGAQLALDSLPLHNANLTASIFDTKSSSGNISSLILDRKLDSMDLLIGSVRESDYTQLAYFALRKNIPFISATYPNDGGIKNNPYVIVINSTLKSHCEAIYSYLLQNHGTDDIILCRKKGSQEDKVENYLKQFNAPDGKPLLDIEVVNIDSNFSFVRNKLDSNKHSVIIGGSLDEDFAVQLIGTLYGAGKKYPLTLVGMPNWDGFMLSRKNSFKDFPVYFTSPYFNYKTDTFSHIIQSAYLDRYKGVPSDLTYKGFETVFIFSRLLARHPEDFMLHLNDYSYKIFSEFNFKPVHLSGKPGDKPDYFENKHIYFIKVMNGSTSKAW
jgi:hypothetical protein